MKARPPVSSSLRTAASASALPSLLSSSTRVSTGLHVGRKGNASGGVQASKAGAKQHAQIIQQGCTWGGGGMHNMSWRARMSLRVRTQAPWRAHATHVRPGGRSRSTDAAMSPKRTSAMVRGMGVADSDSTCGDCTQVWAGGGREGAESRCGMGAVAKALRQGERRNGSARSHDREGTGWARSRDREGMGWEMSRDREGMGWARSRDRGGNGLGKES
eukprot:351201-Chlamydomonas_euryale.AAC.6